MMESGRKSAMLPTGRDWRVDAAEYTLKHLIFSDRERKAFIAWILNIPNPLKSQNIMSISQRLKTWRTSRRRVRPGDDIGDFQKGSGPGKVTGISIRPRPRPGAATATSIPPGTNTNTIIPHPRTHGTRRKSLKKRHSQSAKQYKSKNSPDQHKKRKRRDAVRGFPNTLSSHKRRSIGSVKDALSKSKPKHVRRRSQHQPPQS